MVDTVENMANNLLKNSETILNRALDNNYINVSLKILLGLYAALVAPKLSPSLANLMDNTVVRILVAFVIVFMATRDPGLALLISVAFIITLQTANKLRLYNTSLSKSLPNETSWLPSAKNIVDETNNDENNKENNENVVTYSEPSQNLNTIENLEGANIVDTLEGSPLDTDFTSTAQFNDSQSNEVPNVDQNSCIKTLNNQHCIQGLEQNSPDGYTKSL